MCEGGGGVAADLPRTLTFTDMAGNNKPAYLHQIDVTDFVICSKCCSCHCADMAHVFMPYM